MYFLQGLEASGLVAGFVPALQEGCECRVTGLGERGQVGRRRLEEGYFRLESLDYAVFVHYWETLHLC